MAATKEEENRRNYLVYREPSEHTRIIWRCESTSFERRHQRPKTTPSNHPSDCPSDRPPSNCPQRPKSIPPSY